jgi:hypothetical protein
LLLSLLYSIGAFCHKFVKALHEYDRNFILRLFPESLPRRCARFVVLSISWWGPPLIFIITG